LEAVLAKIKKLTDQKASRFVVKKGAAKFEGKELVSFSINPTLATGTIVFDDGVTTHTYDKADIIGISRLRSKRWAIEIAPNANPA
jgi:hypothetical protein